MNINELDNRAAMGLEKSYVASIKDNISHLYEKLRPLSKMQLIDFVENRNIDLLTRYASGQILATVGDPRISSFSPKMIDIPSAEVEIGIEEKAINSVLNSFSHLELKREWIIKETPRHNVFIKPFRVAKYLITNSEFKEFLEDTKFEELPSSWEFGIYPEFKANHPVYSISYKAAIGYTNWLSRKTKRKFRLLTENEWEYVASGKHHKEYPWGNKKATAFANTLESKLLCSSPVGIFVEGNSEFGASDMGGNVEEYVSCDYKPYSNNEYIHDDIALILGSYKVCRGGSFTRHLDLARCTRRHGAYPKDIYIIGFRIAEDF